MIGCSRAVASNFLPACKLARFMCLDGISVPVNSDTPTISLFKCINMQIQSPSHVGSEEMFQPTMEFPNHNSCGPILCGGQSRQLERWGET